MANPSQEEVRAHVAANWKTHAHPETSDPSMPMETWDIHTKPEHCDARMCTYGPPATHDKYGSDAETKRLWGSEPEEMGAAYIAKHGKKAADGIADALAEQARSQWSGDESEKWW